ncbi:MAG: helix-turn-helix transcriptional regulator [Actinomycetota bacterium]|nr:helix-turn-helix transcriptional regulator [Actinomycetota bacterium]
MSPRRARLAARLKAIRAGVAPSGSEFARIIGWQQPRVSKLESGKQLPTEADISAWVAAGGANESVAAELLRLLAAARIEYVTHRDESRIEGGLSKVQDAQAAAEARVMHIAEWQPAMVPGLVQTAAYARELFERPGRPTLIDPGDVDADAMATGRVRRQDILYQPGRRIELILGESALRSTPGTIGTLLGQLDRLVSVIDLPTVELGIVPFPLMPVMPVSSFYMHDEIVYIETLTAEQQLAEPDEVAVYVKAFNLLREAAVFGPSAAALIQRVAGELRHAELRTRSHPQG